MDNINDILNSINNIQKATPKPYMYTRVIAKLQHNKNTIWEKLYSFITKPLVAFGFILLLLVLNTAAILQDSGKEDKTDAEELVINNSDILTNYNNDLIDNVTK